MTQLGWQWASDWETVCASLTNVISVELSMVDHLNTPGLSCHQTVLSCHKSIGRTCTERRTYTLFISHWLLMLPTWNHQGYTDLMEPAWWCLCGSMEKWQDLVWDDMCPDTFTLSYLALTTIDASELHIVAQAVKSKRDKSIQPTLSSRWQYRPLVSSTLSLMPSSETLGVGLLPPPRSPRPSSTSYRAVHRGSTAAVLGTMELLVLTWLVLQNYFNLTNLKLSNG